MDRRFPGARIEWVTSPAYTPLLEGLPELAAVHRLGRGRADGVAALRERLRGRFDLAIDLQEKVKSRYLARVASPRRLLYRRRTRWVCCYLRRYCWQWPACRRC